MMIVDLHVHTINGSHCSVLSPSDLVKYASGLKVDGICITDHNTMWDIKPLKKVALDNGFRLFHGMEVNTDLGHILVFGLPGYVSGISKAETLRRVLDEEGGAMVIAHPFREEMSSYYSFSYYNATPKLSVEDILRRPIFGLVDAMEVANGGSTRDELDFSIKAGEKLGIKGTGGSDAHSPYGVGCCVTIFENEIYTEEDLIREIRAGRFKGVDRRQEMPQLIEELERKFSL